MSSAKAGKIVNTKVFAELFNKPEDFELVFQSIEHTIMASFAIDRKVLGREPEITNNKVRERWYICEKWFRCMRGELGWGLTRTLDTLPKALACELLDMQFDPSKEDLHAFSKQSIDSIVRRY